jgi:long-chain acyl-CoA synthetase
VILFTSGTSGGAKGAVLTHAGIRASGQCIADALELGPDDAMLGSAPFTHVLGQTGALVAPFLGGSTVLVVPRFDAAATTALMVETRTTILLGVPTMCVALCELARTGVELPPIRIAHVGGAPVPIEVTRDFERTFAGAAMYEGYGLTEICGIATTYGPGQLRKAGSVGTPRGDIELQIVSPEREPLPAREIGEIELRGSAVIPGYWNNPEATAAAISPDGWLATGDMGYVDEDGYLYLVDRKKDLILRGGYSVYPREVEEVLYAHPDVLEAAVVGVPDERLGEEIVAVVVPRSGAQLDGDVLRAYTREHVAAYKYPRHVVVVDDLPKGPTGKILKRSIDTDALREQLGR